MSETPDKGWCKVSLMGHKTFCGYVAQDGGLHRCDIYAADPAVSEGEDPVLPISWRNFGDAGIYDIEPITKAEAIAFVQRQIAERERMEQWRREREERARELEAGGIEDAEAVEDYGESGEISDYDGRIRVWAAQGRTPAWMAHQIEVSLGDLHAYLAEHSIAYVTPVADDEDHPF